MTIADFYQKSCSGIAAQSVDGESERVGIKVLELTNEFRSHHGLSALKWESSLAKIAMVHCKNMAEHVVPIGHDGFAER